MWSQRLKQGLLMVAVLGLAAKCWAPVDAAAPPKDRVARILEAADARSMNQSDFWFKDGDFPQVIQVLRYRAKLHPEDYEISTDLGWMLGNIELYDEQLAVAVEYRRNNPNYVDGPLPEAEFYYMKRAYGKVPNLLESQIGLKPPPHPNTFRNLAHSYEKLSYFADSKRVWEAYLKIYPGDEAAKRNLERVEKKLRGEKIAPPPPK